jgi:bifunctional non-homologous end joining protein LigD
MPTIGFIPPHQGLNPTNRRALLKLLQPLTTPKCPFVNLPTTKSGHWGEGVTAEEMSDYTWLRPEIEAEIKFAEWTAGGVLRHAEFVAPHNLAKPSPPSVERPPH